MRFGKKVDFEEGAELARGLSVTGLKEVVASLGLASSNFFDRNGLSSTGLSRLVFCSRTDEPC